MRAKVRKICRRIPAAAALKKSNSIAACRLCARDRLANPIDPHAMPRLPQRAIFSNAEEIGIDELATLAHPAALFVELLRLDCAPRLTIRSVARQFSLLTTAGGHRMRVA